MLGKFKTTKLHFIGIGGIGMSGIAEVLLGLGYQVSGSDLNKSAVTDNLVRKGATIYQGHFAANVEGASLVIYSSAIDPNNPEIKKAMELQIPMIRRAEMLAELMRLKFGIAVAGSHGKTTTTSLIATIFQAARLDATHIIGGIVSNLGGNAHKGDGDFLIAEADESDGSFLLLNPIMAAVTNIDDDHLDYYGTKEKVTEAFIQFANKLPFFGQIVMNADDQTSWEIRSKINRPVLWYGIGSERLELSYLAKDVNLSASGTTFELLQKGISRGEFSTNLLGLHNVSNTLAAIAISSEAGIDWEIIRQGLLNFRGVGRRLEKLYEKDGFLLLDDYGHHPTEIKATIDAIKKVDQRKLIVIFEPHRYSRTQNFWREFQSSFKDADEVYMLPIYAASEKEIPGISTENLIMEMRSKGMNANFLKSFSEMNSVVQKHKCPETILLALGAGSISKNIREAIKGL